MEAWPIKVVKAPPISRKLEIAQNAKSCSKQKKLPSNLWQALQSAELPTYNGLPA